MRTLLMIGPQPPPIGGSSLTLKAILDELANYAFLKVVLINTSPSTDPRGKMTGFGREKVCRLVSIALQYWRGIGQCDAVLVFANNLFAATLLPLLLLVARMYRRPFFVKPVGGDLDLYLAAHSHLLRTYMLCTLRVADGIFAQTKLLRTSLQRAGCANAYYLPGFRSRDKTARTKVEDGDTLRLVFLAHITREKGALILLEALQRLTEAERKNVRCDFYGPIHFDVRDGFCGNWRRHRTHIIVVRWILAPEARLSRPMMSLCCRPTSVVKGTRGSSLRRCTAACQ